jgi:transcription-repair coupling factor (superfamily II helicase)
LSLSVLEPAKPLLLAGLQRELGRPTLVVVASEARARTLASQLGEWSAAPETIALLPAPEPLIYERTPSHPTTAQNRLKALEQLASDEPRSLVVASVRALMRLVMAPSRFRQLRLDLRVGDRVRLEELISAILRLGYVSEPLVEYPGTFSRRGGIVDVFPVDADVPLRIEYFGDEVDTIREFDPSTQRSQKVVSRLRLSPAREVELGQEDALAALAAVPTTTLSDAGADHWSRDLIRLSGGIGFDGSEFYVPYFGTHTVVDFVPDGGLIVVDEPASVAAAASELVDQANEMRAELIDRGELPGDFRQGYVEWSELLNRARSRARLELSWQDGDPDRLTGGHVPGEIERLGRLADARPVPSYAGQLHAALDDVERWRASEMTVLLVSQQSARVLDVLEEQGIPAAIVAELLIPPEPGALVLVHGALDEGFQLSANDLGGLVTLTDHELFGWTKPTRTSPSRRPSRDAFLSDLSPGDYVVHVDHGVGRFARMIRLPSETGEREYLVLEYAAGDRLYVPVDQADRVTRYVGVGEHTPTLHRLGTTEWSRARSRVRAAVQEMAGELLRLYAARQVRPGHGFLPDSVWQRELEDSFPYVETPDQLKAIREVKLDMEAPHPMDRLLCGDVGYGKTEVALRAAFKAVNDGRQVAVLVPTTVLAQQHFNTFRERLQAFPVKVEMLSRFRSDKEQRQVTTGLAVGTVDICIGTHRLVQPDVSFKNLGLVIVDEEQRFGVAHKEYFKKLRTEVDVLTLSATPIPRTLHMALVGARDLSVMETPPEERLPIRTTVGEYDESLIRDVILRELDRGGQVYFVHNRVQTIYQMAHRLADLVPHASIAVGHGQLPEEELEKVMLDFAAGRYDVLVCSTIIESGLDIPNVNTIIVNQAENLGLAQLYQLRGRVGRGANRAYAYFLTPKNRQLSEVAEKRLRTIFEATDLGAGYRIALKDLEIRGAGNLLGAEQHGNVAAVGFHLFTQLLAEAVKELKGEPIVAVPNVAIDLPLDAYLPTSYVEDEQSRLSLYTRLAGFTEPSQVGELLGELRDRYGELPEAALNLIYLVQLKLLAASANIAKISADGDQVVIQLSGDRRVDAASLQRRFGSLVLAGRSQARLSREKAGANWLAILQDVVDSMAPVTADAATPLPERYAAAGSRSSSDRSRREPG